VTGNTNADVCCFLAQPCIIPDNTDMLPFGVLSCTSSCLAIAGPLISFQLQGADDCWVTCLLGVLQAVFACG